MSVYCEACDAMHPTATCEDIERIQPRKSYALTDRYGESGYRLAVYRRAEVEAVFGPVTADNADEVTAALTGWTERYGGPGRAFTSAPSLRVRPRNITIRQFCGLDI